MCINMKLGCKFCVNQAALDQRHFDIQDNSHGVIHPQTDRHNAQRYLTLNCVGETGQRWLTCWMIEDKMAGMVEILIGGIQVRSF